MSQRYSKSVLLVDDDPADRKLLSRALLKSGFDLVVAAEADAAMAAIVGGRIGCIVTDQVMPISGMELARSAQQVRSDISVIFVSGAGPKKDIPKNAIFVSKEDREKLVAEVTRCMAQWAIP